MTISPDAWREFNERLGRNASNHSCQYCHRDIRIQGGSRDGDLATCNNCLREHMQCEICGNNHFSTSLIRITDFDIEGLFEIATDISEGDSPIQPFYRDERYRICAECYHKLQDRHFLESIRRIKCKICNVRYGAATIRFTSGDNTINSHRVCFRCLPHARESYERMSHELTQRYLSSPGTVTPEVNEWEGVLELKGDVCYIWNPSELNIVRKYSRETYVDIEVEGRSHDFNFARARDIKRTLIFDGDIIWVIPTLKLDRFEMNTDFAEHRSFSGMFYGASPPLRNTLRFRILTNGLISTRDANAERTLQEERRREEQRAEQLPYRLGIHHEMFHVNYETGIPADSIPSIPNASALDFITEALALGTTWTVHDGEQVDVTPERPDPPFSEEYHDGLGRILAYCSCGFTKKLSPRQTMLHHANGSVNAEILHHPGDWIQHMLSEGHIVTLRKPT